MTESVRKFAEQRLEREEREGRDRRLAELEREETERRDRERRDAERAAAREAARQEAERLASERSDLEDRADREISQLARTLEELRSLDREHQSALSASGRSVYLPPFDPMLRRWADRRLWSRVRDAESLRKLDPLTRDADG